ncbi:uncharacterized protein TNCT_500751 [Trichonephila clavata]|uniref:Uncharacterized protein n=1 Tax=Trichonephila clavata TaxID=2740835 RepID=A0A8X6HCN3_TRICU|nr:uncharacterized protein TNCT_500751 [Trichonephila clavata]
MSWNRLLLLLMHLHVGVSQLTMNEMLDAQTELSEQNAYMWPVRVFNAKEYTDCENVGFRNATKNSCGFCTGGNTKLSDRYYMDCAGKCEGNISSVDCNGDCRGAAYIDECSGKCVGGNSEIKEKDVKSYRNCRGDCVSSGIELYTDSCGVCHAGTSPFQDCTNKCYLPDGVKKCDLKSPATFKTEFNGTEKEKGIHPEGAIEVAGNDRDRLALEPRS